jgi:cell division protein FtsA
MEPKEYIAAIDLGSSKIIGMVGWKRQDNTLEVIAVEKIDSSTCIRRGTIHNLEETIANTKHILRKLDNRIHPQKLSKVYVGVAGQSIHTVNHKVYRDLGKEEYINDELIRSLLEECRDMDQDNVEVLEVIPNEYKLDAKKTEINPVGVACSEIEANVRLIVGRTTLKRNITRMIEEKSEISLAGLPISQMAAASVLLSDADKVLGCGLIDFGAGTTSVSIYKDGLLRHLAVIPFGGNVVTKDICSANLMEADAEKLKTSFGSAIFNPESDNKVFRPRATGALDEPKIELHTLNNIIEARMTEIIQNVWAQMESSGFSKQLGAGIYCTGGGSQLRNLTDLIKRITGLEAKKAGGSRNILNSSTSNESMQNPAYSVVLGMLMSGSTNCIKTQPAPSYAKPVQTPEEEEAAKAVAAEQVVAKKKKKEDKKPIGKKISQYIGSLFGDAENEDTEMK